MLGLAPRIFWIACVLFGGDAVFQAAISGLTLISVSAVAISNLVSKSYTVGHDISCPTQIQNFSAALTRWPLLRRPGFNHGFENDEAGRRNRARIRRRARDGGIRPATFGVATADCQRCCASTVGIACFVIGPVGRGVAEKNLFVLFEVGDVGFVGGVAASEWAMGNFQDLPLRPAW